MAEEHAWILRTTFYVNAELVGKEKLVIQVSLFVRNRSSGNAVLILCGFWDLMPWYVMLRTRRQSRFEFFYVCRCLSSREVCGLSFEEPHYTSENYSRPCTSVKSKLLTATRRQLRRSGVSAWIFLWATPSISEIFRLQVALGKRREGAQRLWSVMS